MPRPATRDPLITQLRTTRQHRGIHQDTIAHLTGVDRTSVTGWENGRADLPLSRLRAWAAALGYTLTLTPTDPALRYRDLIAERDRLILAGVNPDALAVPIEPPEPTP